MRWKIPVPQTFGKKIALGIVLFLLIGGWVWFAAILPSLNEKEDCSVIQKSGESSTVGSCAPQEHPFTSDMP